MRNRHFALALALAVAFVAPAAAARGVFAGKLRTRGNKPVVVNGNKVASGTTVYSGAQVECPAKVGATIEVPSLGRLDIAPGARLTLTFAGGRVDVTLHSGYAVLTTNAGVNGTVSADGKVFRTDPSKQSSVVGRTAGSAGPETAGAAGAGAAAGKAGVLAGVGAAGAAAAGAAAGRGRGRNLSPTTPRGPQ